VLGPYDVVKQLEQELCRYTGAPYAVTVNSCTMALLLAVAWHLRNRWVTDSGRHTGVLEVDVPAIEIPRRTYVSVPMSIIHAGGRPTFRDEEWSGCYQLKPLPVWDCARAFHGGMYAQPGQMLCVSFHASKILGDTQGGAILLDDMEARDWLREARFDGRVEGMTPANQAAITGAFRVVGWHCYMSNDVAARLLLKLYSLPRDNEPLPNDPYPDLSTMEIFK
jgi:dTDP-4-amino-4,6-dideoxygalactose transaminase